MIPVLFVLIGVGSGGYGLFNGARGVDKYLTSRKINEEIEAELSDLRVKVGERLNGLVEDFFCLDQIKAEGTVFVNEALAFVEGVLDSMRMRNIILLPGAKKHNPIVANLELQKVQNLYHLAPADTTRADVMTVLSVVKGISKSGVMVKEGATLAAKRWGKTALGKSIGKLSGAALEKSALAWVGGGSLASGGGGMALGAKILGGVNVGTWILTIGSGINSIGNGKLVSARTFQSRFESASAEMNTLFKQWNIKKISCHNQIQAICDNLEALLFSYQMIVKGFNEGHLSEAMLLEFYKNLILFEELVGTSVAEGLAIISDESLEMIAG